MRTSGDLQVLILCRRMAALVSLRPSDDLGPDILSLSMGQLFHEVGLLFQHLCIEA